MNIAKRFKQSPVKIGTHNGVFHCDELLATYMLQQIFSDSKIIRSRENDILKECDIVVDVGNVYDPDKFLFDHHQKGFNESMKTVIPSKPWTVKLSSAGLVYAHFGLEVIKTIVGDSSNDKDNNEKFKAVFDKIYEDFIQEIDAIDNGVPMFDGEPKYRITTNLSTRVNIMFNKNWNTSDIDFNEDEAFFKAQKYVGSEFRSRLLNAANIWWPAREIVSNAIKNRFSIDSSGQVMELEKFCPWKEHFFNLEKELSVSKPILYCIFCDREDSWRVQAVSLNSGSYICRLFLPSEWNGLRDDELCEVAGIEGCMFSHHTGFIGGNKTREGALKMALKSIELGKL